MNAIIFDLDDTLYRERRWVVSGFAAVARHLAVAAGLDRQQVFRLLVRALRTGRRQEALQLVCRRFGLPVALVPGLVALIRSHRPALTLRRSTVDTLTTLRATWRLGVLTNGLPEVQARKSAALGIGSMVDAVVYAADHGGGKPAADAFLTAASRVGVSPKRCVFVGDDLWCDVHGARQVGMRTIRVRHAGCGSGGVAEPDADAVVDDLTEVAGVAGRLLGTRPNDADDHLWACG